VAEDVKALDQDARSLLRKHGVRFGQFTVFFAAFVKTRANTTAAGALVFGAGA